MDEIIKTDTKQPAGVKNYGGVNMQNNLNKIELIRQMLETAENNVRSAKQLLSEITGVNFSSDFSEKAKTLSIIEGGKVIEGVFDGQAMVAPDGRKYPVPANYASKSKLVAGDILKLTIAPDGSFIYKQIGPVKRKKMVGILSAEDGNYKIIGDGKVFNVLLASVTYYKAKPGDEVTILIPEDEESDWATIEAVIYKPETQPTANEIPNE